MKPQSEGSSGTALRTRLARLALVTAVLAAAALALRRLVPGSAPAAVATFFMAFLLVAEAAALLGWLWRVTTYRVGVRLFLSYLIIGVFPFVIMGCLGAVVGYMATGQYASVRFGTLLDRTYESLAALAENAARALPADPREVLVRQATVSRAPLPAFEWVAKDGPRLATSPGLDGLEPPEDGLLHTWTGPVLAGGRPWVAAASGDRQRWVAVLVPMRDAAEAAARQAGWFEASLGDAVVIDERSQEPTVSVRLEEPTSPAGSGAPEAATASTPEPAGWLHQRFVLWPRVSEAPIEWPGGATQPDRRLAVVVRTSPAEAWASFMKAPYRLADEVLAALLGLGILFAVLYAIVVGFAVVMIVSITRSTARLTRGARAVAAGDFGARIPVKRRDQLGDLAVAFNTMTAAVDRMLHEVADRERLRREMELAREIQQSLLPATHLVHAGLAISAHFLPASEVGGDYFDVFPLPRREVVVTVGDVAGHGVSTGLLMAMVKSAMGTLVLEGYRGAELLERLNRLVLQQSVKHRMATLVLARVSAENGTAEITSCGHPPVLLVRPAGEVEEVLLSSLPLGTRLPVEPASRIVAFPPGSKLVLYSDGLLEAVDQEGHPLGAEGLGAIIRRHARRPAAELVAAILGGLHEHIGARPPADDLTILVVEHSPDDAGG
ncbi:MAG TPA: SpoIIE family protein phosphatase [Thermoanaerobaculaceae bacterium]|nr:SpoIIE family protein phosphatase [Thermoanaerobaculaceae bacterium]HRS15283.1 SpoIIE family protein phosphatase [Thermoanaerobaculaceae bacterium]